VIIDDDGLPALAGAVSMVDGGFDPVHRGHLAYLRAAAALGLPLLCNLAPDSWVSRKHPPLLEQAERAELIDAIRWVDYVHLASGSTADVLRALRPRYYVKGADWRDRLPAAEIAVCTELGIEPVFLDTVLDSSTAVVERLAAALRRET
jgi:D-beta-D-heptose 7-phosphate kinase / D-beta-D-heptose 1-phosphate adenosyltransferase